MNKIKKISITPGKFIEFYSVFGWLKLGDHKYKTVDVTEGDYIKSSYLDVMGNSSPMLIEDFKLTHFGEANITNLDLTVDQTRTQLPIELLAEALDAMQDFCDKVDRGEARSRRTYARFKDILKKNGR